MCAALCPPDSAMSWVRSLRPHRRRHRGEEHVLAGLRLSWGWEEKGMSVPGVGSGQCPSALQKAWTWASTWRWEALGGESPGPQGISLCIPGPDSGLAWSPTGSTRTPTYAWWMTDVKTMILKSNNPCPAVLTGNRYPEKVDTNFSH